MSEILTKHFTSNTKDRGWGSLGKISNTYKLENTITLISVICSSMSKIMQDNDN